MYILKKSNLKAFFIDRSQIEQYIVQIMNKHQSDENNLRLLRKLSKEPQNLLKENYQKI